MLTRSAQTSASTAGSGRSSGAGSADARREVQKVLIVNGNPEVLSLAEQVVEAGHYDMVFVESVAHAYSEVRRIQPNLVILCLDLDDVAGIQVLSMLKLDARTRTIPVLTYSGERKNDREDETGDRESSAVGFFEPQPAAQMN